MDWLIEKVLVSKQPGIVGGPKKSLKTSTLTELTISLGAGIPFLGKFAVPKRRRTVFISGESGEAVLKETASRICQSKGIALDDTDTYWDFRLPKVSRGEELVKL